MSYCCNTNGANRENDGSAEIPKALGIQKCLFRAKETKDTDICFVCPALDKQITNSFFSGFHLHCDHL